MMDTPVFVDYYLPGDMDAVLIGNIAYIDPDAKDIPYKYNRLKYHETEHYYTCPFNLLKMPKEIQEKYEHIADRRVAEKYMPVQLIIFMYQSGIRTLEDMADTVKLDELYIKDVLYMYQSIHGYNYKYMGYIINFVPLTVEKAG